MQAHETYGDSIAAHSSKSAHLLFVELWDISERCCAHGRWRAPARLAGSDKATLQAGRNATRTCDPCSTAASTASSLCKTPLRHLAGVRRPEPYILCFGVARPHRTSGVPAMRRCSLYSYCSSWCNHPQTQGQGGTQEVGQGGSAEGHLHVALSARGGVHAAWGPACAPAARLCQDGPRQCVPSSPPLAEGSFRQTYARSHGRVLEQHGAAACMAAEAETRLEHAEHVAGPTGQACRSEAWRQAGDLEAAGQALAHLVGSLHHQVLLPTPPSPVLERLSAACHGHLCAQHMCQCAEAPCTGRHLQHVSPPVQASRDLPAARLEVQPRQGCSVPHQSCACQSDAARPAGARSRSTSHPCVAAGGWPGCRAWVERQHWKQGTAPRPLCAWPLPGATWTQPPLTDSLSTACSARCLRDWPRSPQLASRTGQHKRPPRGRPSAWPRAGKSPC